MSAHTLYYPQESFSGKLSAVQGTGVFNTPSSTTTHTSGNGDDTTSGDNSGDTAGETGDKCGDTAPETGDTVPKGGDKVGDHVTVHEVEWSEGEFMVK